MDELNVHQCWGISPFLNLLDCAAAAQEQASWGAAAASPAAAGTALLQVCPYDCRHTLATISSKATCTAAESCGQQCAERVEIFVYEPEPEGLARHMLLLVVLFDAALTARERAEMFLELHGNVLLRQLTADWLATASKWLEAAISGIPCVQGQQHQQHQPRQLNPAQAALDLFDLSMLRYKERDLLLETFQRFRSKSSFDVAAAWGGRCRKWYGDRYDFRQNMVDWDYHMRLSQRGTPYLDPAAGSIIHFHHFRHWRLTGVAYELRGSSYTATNTSMLATAYGRTREYKDRKLQDVGRSVSAYGYWGDILNPPYHAFGTLSDDQALFRLVNKQFTHTAVDVAEHNVLSFIKRLSGIAAGAAGAAVAEGQPGDASRESTGGHRANAARGPTSLEGLAASAAPQQQQQQQQQETSEQGPESTPANSSSSSVSAQAAALGQAVDAAAAAGKDASGTADDSGASAVRADAATAADQGAAGVQGISLQDAQQQQAQQTPLPGSSRMEQQQEEPNAAKADQQTSAEAVQVAAAVQHLQQHVRIRMLTGDLKRSLTSKACFKQHFAAATVGHRHVHLLAREMGLAGVLQASAPVFVETAANMVQLNGEQVATFDKKLLELAAAAGFEAHPAYATQQVQPGTGKQKQQEQAEPPTAAAHGDAPVNPKSWQLPAGHLALRRSACDLTL